MIGVSLLGFGTVGTGVYEVLENGAEGIEKKVGAKIELRHILDIRDFSEHERAPLFTKSFDDILADGETKIVVEVMGGLSPAYEYTKRALLSGRHVITSNKELVATHGAELLEIAASLGVNYLFEASVGGGIPIIRPLNECLAANRIYEVMGILNGTTNYILTKMAAENQSFSAALSDAQEKGYAERNPAADVEGHDTCRKIAILSSLVFGRQIDYRLIPTEGITGIDPADFALARSLGMVIKLIGQSKILNSKVTAEVCPMLLPVSHPLSSVGDVYNAILVRGDAIGDVMFYGQGAGKLPTASAVVADIISAARPGAPGGRYIWGRGDEGHFESPAGKKEKWLVRVRPPYLEKAAALLGGGAPIPAAPGEGAFVTGAFSRREIDEIIKDSGGGIIKKIRMAAGND